MSEIVIGDQSIPYTLIRSEKARQIRLSMNMTEFRVVAPKRASSHQIADALSAKRKWILRHYTAFQDKFAETHRVARFQSGAKIPYWGRLTRLTTQVADVSVPQINYRHGFQITHPHYDCPKQQDDQIEMALHTYLKGRFADEVESFVSQHSQSLGRYPKTVRIKQMSRRWGSCSSSGCISIDWRLVYAPKKVASYVVAHELAHLEVFDHSSRFWKVLQSIYGDFSHEHKWLKTNDHLLGYVRLPLKGESNGIG